MENINIGTQDGVNKKPSLYFFIIIVLFITWILNEIYKYIFYLEKNIYKDALDALDECHH